ncbi:hypothetical protein JTE90_004771 [Oedothorax gibbosus]|uniref:Uncharacterized protein n=1 Tax=Oedothorax gibbosus TaxID=931172 RepID=A0AAV6VGI1_9ARAC|nr:hypothetical protein JTE90_004771 [Oedothorax gibbosus]
MKSLFILFLVVLMMFAGVLCQSQSESCTTVNGRTECTRQSNPGNSGSSSSSSSSGNFPPGFNPFGGFFPFGRR